MRMGWPSMLTTSGSNCITSTKSLYSRDSVRIGVRPSWVLILPVTLRWWIGICRTAIEHPPLIHESHRAMEIRQCSLPCSHRTIGGCRCGASIIAESDVIVRLREERLKKGMTLEDLSAASGITWSYIAQVEVGRRNIAVDNMHVLAAGVGVTLRDLL